MRSDKEKIDILLSRALTRKAEPNAVLQQRVLRQWKEKKSMKKSKKWIAAAAAAVGVLAVSVSVGAASRYLNSSQVAESMHYKELAKVFSGEDAVSVNETQTYGEYSVTLLGIASGEKLGPAMYDDDGRLCDDRTYALVAIERTDGAPMPDGTLDEDDQNAMEFFVSPLIRGCNPVNYNLMTMNGGCIWDVIDGVRYQIAECDNVECFADRGLYLCVMNDMFYNKAAYQYDSATGRIAPNADYGEMNLLFELPLDVSRANPKKAEEYLESFEVMFPDAD